MSSRPDPPKRHYTRKQWNELMDRVNVTQEDLNQLVMNYLVVEGYREAAEAFQEETRTETSADLVEMEERMKIRSNIHEGNIDKAIGCINDLNPEILDSKPDLFFHLQRQRLIEMIRSGELQRALEFAQEELAPLAKEKAEFLEELESTMALLGFEQKVDSPVGGLLDVSQRQKVASDVNSAILESEGKETEARMPHLLRVLLYAQTLLDELALYPRVTDMRSFSTSEGGDGDTGTSSSKGK